MQNSEKGEVTDFLRPDFLKRFKQMMSHVGDHALCLTIGVMANYKPGI